MIKKRIVITKRMKTETKILNLKRLKNYWGVFDPSDPPDATPLNGTVILTGDSLYFNI